ncbi:MAG TPA: NDMA-dependent alcohol dehydrogenase [Mycobacteriales bacterium]|nr:NDMA-dependent alcohol dehydrogenase [Mycobacteriales bacterium]HVX70911.1 NDMA-dependent alcohol dehydrogenase [Mycobacteriales bacterium]
MDARAAVLWDTHKPWEIEEITLDDPGPNEVLVELVASGLCHSDEHLVTGDMKMPKEMNELLGFPQYPIIGGHEGAGTVLEVGKNVQNVKPGDSVVFSFIPSCGRCPSCSTGKQSLCDLGQYLIVGRQIDGLVSRHHLAKDGTDVGTMCCLGTFATHTIVNEASCVKLDDDIPVDKAALVGCGVTTGWGSAVYRADVQPGETVVVVGIGGVGINAVQGAAMAGARNVVAVDPVQFKRDEALKFGATHTAASVEEAFALVGEITWGAMAEKAIITTGVAEGSMIGSVLSLVSKGGRCVVTSVASIEASDVTMSLFELTLMQKELVGSIFGGSNPRRDIPRLLRLYKEGKLKLDELITTEYKLDEVNQGYDDMRNGKNLRGLIRY